MTTLLDKLNLRPQERRLVVMAVAVLFIILQVWFVWPHFKDWGVTQSELAKARRTIEDYRAEFARTNDYQIKLAALENEGVTVLVAEQVQPNLLISRIQSQARQSGLNWNRINAAPSSLADRANEFFQEQFIDLGVNPTGDKELIDFLLAVANSELMIRVKDITLSPDPANSRLQGNMRLVASFQKKRTGVASPADNRRPLQPAAPESASP